MKAHCKKLPRGFVLIEALVAMLVLSFGMLAVAGFQTTLSLNSDVAKQRTEATRLAQQKLEQLRTFDTLTTYATNMASSTAGTRETITTNTSFTRTWGITPANPVDTGRAAFVTVAWTDRAGVAQQVQLFSFVSATSPVLNGSLFFPLPDGTILRRPKGRNIDIPIPAISISGTGKSYVPWSGSTGGFLIFSDTSGDIVQKCTATPTAANLSTDTCKTFDGYLLTGYITGGDGSDKKDNNGSSSTNPVSLVTGILFSETQYISGTPECAVANAQDQNNGATIADTKYYACLIAPTDHDSNAATARVWSGRIDLNGTGTGWRNTTTCRFTSDANTTVNNKHPVRYSMVDRSLDNQNFYITTGTCPANSVLHLTNTATS